MLSWGQKRSPPETWLCGGDPRLPWPMELRTLPSKRALEPRVEGRDTSLAL